MVNYKQTLLYKALKCCSGHCFFFLRSACFTVATLMYTSSTKLALVLELNHSRLYEHLSDSSEIACVSTNLERNHCCQVCVIN